MRHVQPAVALRTARALRRFCSTQVPPRGDVSEELVAHRVNSTLQSQLRAEFVALNAKMDSVRTELRTDNSSLRTALRADISSGRTELRDDFRQTLKDREAGFLLKIAAATATVVGLVETLRYQIRINKSTAHP